MFADQEVGWLEVPVHQLLLVHVPHAEQHLEDEFLDVSVDEELLRLDNLLEVCCNKLEHQKYVFGIAVVLDLQYFVVYTRYVEINI